MKARVNDLGTVLMRQAGLSWKQMSTIKQAGWWWYQARADAVRRRTGVVRGQAVVWTLLGPAELVGIDVPLAGAGEVTVAPASTAISLGTERAWYVGLPNAPTKRPFRPGYSGAGTVLAVGDGVTGVAVGDRVAGQFPHQSIVTVAASSAAPVPDGVSLADASMVQLAVIAGYGLARAGLAPGETLAVLGLGPIGALALRLGIAAGAASPVALAASRRREAVADASGASFLTVDDPALDAVAADVVVEATGDAAAIGSAVRAAAPGGRVVLLGSPRGLVSELPVAEIQAKRLRLIGAHISGQERDTRPGAPTWTELAGTFLEGLAGGALAVDDLCTQVVEPREAAAFYHSLAVGEAPFGARFDWPLHAHDLSPSRRVAQFLAPPELDARGIDPDRRPRRAVRAASAPSVRSTTGLRFGLIGCGEIAVATAGAIAAAPNAEVTACFDPVAELASDLAARHGAVAAPTMEALLERSDVDAVVVSVPHHLHAPLSIAAMRAGKHVVTEKPPASNLADAVAMAAASEEAGVALSVLLPMRYQVEVATARRLVEDGALGRVTGGFVHGWQDKPPTYMTSGFTGRTVSDWRSSKARAGGGVLIMNASHTVDAIRFVSGLEIVEVLATMGALDAPAEVEDAIAVALKLSNGAIVTLHAGAAVRGVTMNGMRLWGTDGHVEVEPDLRLFTRRSLAGVVANRWQSFPVEPAPPSRSLFLGSFAAAVAAGRPADVGPDDALALQAAIEAIYRSAESGEAVRPADVLAEARGAADEHEKDAGAAPAEREQP